MGFFSWKTSDTNKSIPNIYSGRDPVPVKMLDDKGNAGIESAYEGYGDFGGMDYYALVAQMHGHEPDRDIGITIAFSDNPNPLPKLVESGCEEYYEDLPDSPMCEYQGYFYD